MNREMTHQQVRAGMTISALCLATLGATLLFAPQEVGGSVLADAPGPVIAQLLGAALLGIAAMNWIARGSALGGIYGRAVIVGNQAHLMVALFVLVKGGLAAGAAGPAYWMLTALYAIGAAFFVYLTFFSSGLWEPRTPGPRVG